ncbi:hypothetical protein BRADI_1g03686v3 [Brachypodium distachyon]|uniref:Uncharacterized protein n=1 Tax=Brachypodium distachyon TaxID=15368 RepID=A0A0Q3GPT7_BRADI|nr:hypothetical protein BRADI_1g03686v3 [Brachypodium distachyon]
MSKQQGFYARSLLLVTVLVVLVLLAMPIASLGLDIGRRGLGDGPVVGQSRGNTEAGGSAPGRFCRFRFCPPPAASVSP